MSEGLEAYAAKQLLEIKNSDLHRSLKEVKSPQGARIDLAGSYCVNFGSNDYLGLANHPKLRAAASAAIEQYGTGSGASRLICGSLKIHGELEESLAAFKGTEAALVFSSGYACAVGVMTTLVGAGDVVIIDKLSHASLVDGARLSGAKLRVFRHNDMDDLERILKWADNFRKGTGGKVLIVTESIFSMDGDQSPLVELVALKHRYGAYLMLDEAHGVGVFGERGQGVANLLGVDSEIDVQMGTLGKAIGSSGGYVCGSRALIDLFVNRARSFIYSTAPAPGNSAAALEGVRLLQEDDGHDARRILFRRLDQIRDAQCLSQYGRGAIQIHIVGGELAAMRVASKLLSQGLFVPAVRFPTVPRGAARLRIGLSAAHTEDDVSSLSQALHEDLSNDQ